MSYPHSRPPKTYAVYRGILLAVLAIGLFLSGLVLFPGLVAVGEGLRYAIVAIHESYDWELF